MHRHFLPKLNEQTLFLKVFGLPFQVRFRSGWQDLSENGQAFRFLGCELDTGFPGNRL
jgi:hypothetical protein